jgi:allophanate hydrolase
MRLGYSLDLSRLAAAHEAGQLTPTEVVADVLAEIAASQPANPAWIHVISREKLLTRAAVVEGRRRCGERLPLYGVPFAVKDNIDVAGVPTTAACPAFSYVASESADAVQRLEAAGALCIGKTNMDQFATGLVGTRSPYGACRNPFDARYISGGSSAGSAVAVSLGHVSFALGTDTAGSGRVPAGFCNIVGWKPTRGLVSTTGVVPACRSLDCVSVFALTADDAARVSTTLVAHDARDAYGRTMTATPPGMTGARLRCGVPRASDLRFFGDETAKAAFTRALATLVSLGAELVEFDYTPFAETARLLYEGPWVAERLAAIRAFFTSSSGEIDPIVRKIIGGGAEFTAADAFEGQYRLEALRQQCSQVWTQLDMLAVPTAGTIYRIDEVLADPFALNANLGYYTNFVNLLDLAAVAVPAKFRDDGLPFGITLIAPAFSDANLLDEAARFQRAVQTPLGATAFSLPPADEKQARVAAEGIARGRRRMKDAR